MGTAYRTHGCFHVFPSTSLILLQEFQCNVYLEYCETLCPLGELSLPDLSGSDLPAGMNLTHFEVVHHNNYYGCVVSVEDDLISSSFPVMNVECS